MSQVTVWSGWLGGLAVGLYVIFQVILTGKAVGVSTGLGNVCRAVTHNTHLKNLYPTSGDWRIWFIIGLPLGGLIALMTTPGAAWKLNFDMGMYEQVFANIVWLKILVLLVGGVMIGYGARLAGGCTSGHSIMGIALLNPPSLIASAGFFAGGIIMVQAMFRLFGAA